MDAIDLKKEIHRLLDAGKEKEATKLIKKYEKGDQSPRDRLFLSFCYGYLDHQKKALRILGEPVPPFRFYELDDIDLMVQMRIGYLYNFFGAKYCADRIFKEVETEVKKRNLDAQKLWDGYHYTLFDFHWTSFRADQAKEYIESSIKTLDPKNIKYSYSIIGKADCLAAMEKYEEAIHLVEKEASQNHQAYFLGVSHQAMGEYYFKMGDFDSAFRLLKKSEHFFNGIKTKDVAYLYTYLGAVLFEKGERAEAWDHLKKSEKILLKEEVHSNAYLEVLYWKEQINKEKVHWSEKVFLRCSPYFSLYPLLVGKADYRGEVLPWFKKRQLENQKNNVWHFCQGKMNPANYDDLKEAKKAVIDLYSGVIVKEDKPIHLTEIQAQLLLGVVGTTHLGCQDWRLADFIYRQDFVNLDSARRRLKERVKGLRELSVILERKKNKYYFKQFDEFDLIIPMDLAVRSPLSYAERVRGKSDLKTLLKLFDISESTARRWLGKSHDLENEAA